MKTLYLECNMGAAGDMLMAALTELMPDKDAFVKELNDLQIPQVNIERTTIAKCGIMGTHMVVTVNGEEEKSIDVPMHAHTHSHVHEEHEHTHEHHHEHSDEEHFHAHHHEHSDEEYSHHHHEHGDDACSHNHTHEHHEEHHTHSHVYEEHEHTHEHSHEGHTHAHGHSHHHTSMKDIEHIIGHLNVPEKVKEDAIAVYKLIADAESHAHGRPVEEVHFHEVGAMDAVADIVGVCLAIYKLAPEQIIASPVHVGYGQIHCAHGILPVPAPATAYLLQNIPMYGGTVEGELCTPTGAALLKYFVSEFGNMPVIKTDSIGYGFGKKEFSRLSCVRAFLGDTEDQTEQIIELKCNLDDMTGERIGLALERLFEAGALDVFTTPIGMKKNRPAILLTCLCRPQQRDTMLHEIFKHTTTIGVRETLCNRYVLDRTETVSYTHLTLPTIA